jgi:hypothetical protein
MKRTFSVITLFSILLTACVGDPGPPGEDGVNIVGQSFEETIDLVAPDYRADFEIPLNIVLNDDDMVLVYHLIGVDNDDFNIWRLLPDTVYTETGEEFQYNFEHNFDFVDIFIEAPSTFDFNSLLSGDILVQTFRVVILPVDFINSSNLDLTNYNTVMEYVQ